jgi:hypothetical protein
MKTLEHEVIEKFRLLDKDAKKRVREIIEREIDTEQQPDEQAFDFDAWLAEVEALQTDIRARLGDTATVGALSLLDELREEAS